MGCEMQYVEVAGWQLITRRAVASKPASSMILAPSKARVTARASMAE